MRIFSRLNAVCSFAYFIAVIGAAMFSSNPVLRIIALIGGITAAALFGLFTSPLKELRNYFLIFAVVSATNPIFVNRGSTPLFYVNNRPYTMEALLYGANNAAALIGSLIWFRIFSLIMTSDKINALMRSARFTGSAAALTLTLRYIPTFKRRFSEIRSAQKTAGFLSGDTYIMRIKADLNVFFSLAMSSLELSAATADSMSARGYKLSPHTDYTKRRVCAEDVIVLICALAAVSAVTAFSVGGKMSCGFYPRIVIRTSPLPAVIYAALCALPAIFEIREMIKWSFSKSKT